MLFLTFTNYQGHYINEYQDQNGSRYVVDIKTTQARDLTPIDGVQGQIVSVNESFPKRIRVLPQAHPCRHSTTEPRSCMTYTRAIWNQGKVAFLTDHQDQVRLAVKSRSCSWTETIRWRIAAS